MSGAGFPRPLRKRGSSPRTLLWGWKKRSSLAVSGLEVLRSYALLLVLLVVDASASSTLSPEQELYARLRSDKIFSAPGSGSQSRNSSRLCSCSLDSWAHWVRDMGSCAHSWNKSPFDEPGTPMSLDRIDGVKAGLPYFPRRWFRAWEMTSSELMRSPSRSKIHARTAGKPVYIVDLVGFRVRSTQ